MLASFPILLLLPFVVYQLAKRKLPSRTWAATGLSFGLIIAPASLGLYALYSLSYIGFFPGMVGLMSSFVHGIPGFAIATALGMRDAHTIVNAQENVVIDLINGVCWGLVYGVLGHLIDRWRGATGNGQRPMQIQSTQ
jgi:hypothetical protein